MYNAVGIDVSKGKSTIAVLQPVGVSIRKPFDVSHTSQPRNELSRFLAFFTNSISFLFYKEINKTLRLD